MPKAQLTRKATPDVSEATMPLAVIIAAAAIAIAATVPASASADQLTEQIQALNNRCQSFVMSKLPDLSATGGKLVRDTVEVNCAAAVALVPYDPGDGYWRLLADRTVHDIKVQQLDNMMDDIIRDSWQHRQ